MTPEIEFAKSLGELSPTKNKLASAMAKLSVEQLEELLRNEGLVEKTASTEPSAEEKVDLADTWGRELAQQAFSELEKVALVDQAIGGLVGYSQGREQKERGEKHTFGLPQAAATLMLPGGAGYQAGRYIAHRDPDIKQGKPKKKSKAKHSSVELLEHAVEKVAETEKDRAHKWGKRGAMVNAGLGAANLANAAATNPHLRDLAKKRPIASAAGAVGGLGIAGGLGYGYGRLAHRAIKGPATDKKVMTKTSAVDLLRDATEKVAGPVASAIQNGVGRVANAAIKSPMATRAAVGAGVGALGGAAGAKPGNRVGGALAGAAVGGAAGAGSRAVAGRVGSMNNAAGKYVRMGMSDAGNATGALGLHRMARMRGAGMGMPGRPVSLDRLK